MLGEILSFVVGLLLMVACVAVMKAFPLNKRSEEPSAHTLQTAIYLAFLAAFVNSGWWQFGGHLLVDLLGWVSDATYRHIGSWINVGVKSAIILAGYLHLKALHQSLPAREQRVWKTWEMPFYPQKLKLFKYLRCTKEKTNG